MENFNQFVQDRDYTLYLEAIDLLQQPNLNENLITGKLKKYYDFVKGIASKAGIAIHDIVKILNNKGVFDFFKKIKFSLKRLYTLVQKGYQYYRQVQLAVAEFVAETKVVKWTEDKIQQLDQFLKKHPKVKRIAGFAVGAILIYIWLNMAFTGDPDYDFDQTNLILAISGGYTLTDIFTGPEGVRLLSLFTVGAFISFPWPGPQSALFILSIIYGLAKGYKLGKIAIKTKRRLRAERR